MIRPVLIISLKTKNNPSHKHTASTTKRNIGKIMSAGDSICKFPERIITAGKIANKRG